MHFHWGRNDTEGSEHTFDGEMYPLELHLVHYSCDYYTLSEAVTDYANNDLLEDQDDDHVLAVIGIMFEVGAANSVLEHMLNDIIVDGITEYSTSSTNELKLYYSELDIADLLPENKEFIGYSGSLTTPPCYETVRWHVMKNTMTVSQEQLNEFRSLLGSTDVNDIIAPNYRQVQELNDRKLYECQIDIDDEQVVKEQASGANHASLSFVVCVMISLIFYC